MNLLLQIALVASCTSSATAYWWYQTWPIAPPTAPRPVYRTTRDTDAPPFFRPWWTTARPGGGWWTTARPGGGGRPTARPGGGVWPTARPGGGIPHVLRTTLDTDLPPWKWAVTRPIKVPAVTGPVTAPIWRLPLGTTLDTDRPPGPWVTYAPPSGNGSGNGTVPKRATPAPDVDPTTLFPPPSTIPPTTTTAGPPGPGVWTGPECFNLDTCLECLCGVESNEEVRTCETEIRPDEFCHYHNPECNRVFEQRHNSSAPCVCGSWQLGEAYVNDCSTGADHLGTPYTLPMSFTHFWQCAINAACARPCVENYLSKHRFACAGTHDPDAVTCKDNWRIHRGGPDGCNQLQPLEAGVDDCCRTPAMGCITEEACLAYICGIESNEGVFRCGVEYGASINCTMSNCNGKGNVEILDPAKETCYCGVYQISADYFRDCSDPAQGYVVPVDDLNKCSGNVNCATQCVRNYIRRYMPLCTGKSNPADLTCEEMATIHRSGPNCVVPDNDTVWFAGNVTTQCNTPIGLTLVAAGR